MHLLTYCILRVLHFLCNLCPSPNRGGNRSWSFLATFSHIFIFGRLELVKLSFFFIYSSIRARTASEDQVSEEYLNKQFIIKNTCKLQNNTQNLKDMDKHTIFLVILVSISICGRAITRRLDNSWHCSHRWHRWPCHHRSWKGCEGCCCCCFNRSNSNNFKGLEGKADKD